MVYETYQTSKTVPRFQRDGYSAIIQAAEYLDRPKAVLKETYTTASKRWWPMLKAQEMVRKPPGTVPGGLVHDLLLIDSTDPWPKRFENSINGDSFRVAPLHLLESHDKSRLMHGLSGEHSPYHGGFDLFGRDRSEWYRLQPFAISLN